MRYEDVELTGSLDVTGSLEVPIGPQSQRYSATGSLFYSLDSGSLQVYDGTGVTGWQDIGGDSGGGGGVSNPDVDYLVVAGGGGGGQLNSYTLGGGGAGGMLSGSLSAIASGSTMTITVGAGGAKGHNDGSDSSLASATGTTFTTVTATGGGAGNNGDGNSGNDGGSGGGGGNGNAASQLGGSGTVGQGHDGGDSTASNRGAGGGGAGAAGADSTGGDGGNGGVGRQFDITGTNTYYAGGGGGGSSNSGTGGTGGSGGGGAGESANGNDTESGTANTGGGGGGSFETATNGAGGSGVVIVAYPTSSDFLGVGGIIGDADNGNRYHQFNTSDTFELGSESDFALPQTDSLNIHWDAGHFDSRGTSTWTDLSGNSRNGTVSGASLGSNFYYTFDGSNDHIVNGYHKPAGAQSLIVWYRFAGNGSNGYSLSGFQEGSGKYFYIGRQNTDSRPYWYAGNDGGAITTETISNDTWVMLAVTIDGSNNIAVYRDDSSIHTTTTTSNVAGAVDFRIGAVNDTPNHHHNGDIGMAFHYTTALTAAEISQLYKATKRNFT